MNNLVCYKPLSEWDARSLPTGFRKRHNTQAGTWAKLTIIQGSLKYFELSEDDEVLSTHIFDIDNQPPFVEPQAWHKIEPNSDDLKCQLSFYCEEKDYYHKKYGISATHSEMFDLIKYIQSGDVLDLGCGQGRNSLFLQQQGFNVTAFDANPNSVETVKQIIQEEQLENIYPHVADANLANISEYYDVIMSTVVFMFLQRDKHPDIIKNMQEQTRSGGYNLIVCALDTDEYPCPEHLPFKSPMNAGELKEYYKDWDIKKYNEDIGHLHRTDENGNRIGLQFATIIAQKP
ncbi:MAG: SAM-dependent methyltransferase TehB [Gammaproteobacteria bacterium]|nr:SAM-dependent methyltransferase TehB [Gammaproteobacteria bacterium]